MLGVVLLGFQVSDEGKNDALYAFGTFLFWLIVCSPIAAFLAYKVGYGAGYGIDRTAEFTRGAYAFCYAISTYQTENPDTLKISQDCNEYAVTITSELYADTPGFDYDN